MQAECVFDTIGLGVRVLFEEEDPAIFNQRLEKLKAYVEKVRPGTKFVQIGNRLLWTNPTFSRYKNDTGGTVAIVVLNSSSVESKKIQSATRQEQEIAKALEEYIEVLLKYSEPKMIPSLLANSAYYALQEKGLLS